MFTGAFSSVLIRLNRPNMFLGCCMYTIVYNNESFLCTSQVWAVSKILSKSPTSCHLLVATVSFAFEGSAAVLLGFG